MSTESVTTSRPRTNTAADAPTAPPPSMPPGLEDAIEAWSHLDGRQRLKRITCEALGVGSDAVGVDFAGLSKLSGAELLWQGTGRIAAPTPLDSVLEVVADNISILAGDMSEDQPRLLDRDRLALVIAIEEGIKVALEMHRRRNEALAAVLDRKSTDPRWQDDDDPKDWRGAVAKVRARRAAKAPQALRELSAAEVEELSKLNGELLHLMNAIEGVVEEDTGCLGAPLVMWFDDGCPDEYPTRAGVGLVLENCRARAAKLGPLPARLDAAIARLEVIAKGEG